MAKLVFDIETSALPLEIFDEVQQEYLLRETQKIEDETARAVRREEILRPFSRSPSQGFTACLKDEPVAALSNFTSCPVDFPQQVIGNMEGRRSHE